MAPDKNSEDLVWAGFKNNKKRFETIILNSIKSNETKLVLNVSRYGGGKTHSSYFFSKNKNLPDVDGELTEPFHVIIKTPKEGNNAPTEFYTKVIEGVKLSRISDGVSSLRKDTEKSLRQLQEWANSEDLGKILWLLGDPDEDTVFEAEQVLFGNVTAALRKKLRVRRGITSNADRAQIISAIFQLLSRYGEEGKLELPRRIFVWLDELESLIYYTSRQYRPFTQTIREIIDFTPQYLTIFMNFSFAEPDDVQNIEIVIGEALLDRVTEQFVFAEADESEGKIYIKELFENYRISGFDNDKFFPFTEEAIELVLKNAPNETGRPIMPRTINRWCYYAIQEGNKRRYFESTPIKLIERDFIEELTFSEESGSYLLLN